MRARADCLAAKAVGKLRSETAEIRESESIQVDVVDHLAEVIALPAAAVTEGAETAFDEDSLVASSEEMAPETVAGVDAAGDRVLEPSHALDEVRLRRFEDPVVVVVHENPRVGPEPRQIDRLGKGFGEDLAVLARGKLGEMTCPR